MNTTHFPREKNRPLYEVVDRANAAFTNCDQLVQRYADFGSTPRKATAKQYTEFLKVIGPDTNRISSEILVISSDVMRILDDVHYVYNKVHVEETDFDRIAWFNHLSTVLSALLTSLHFELGRIGNIHQQFATKRNYKKIIEDGNKSLKLAYMALVITIAISLFTYFFPRENTNQETMEIRVSIVADEPIV